MLAPTNAHWAHVMDYGPFSLRVLHKEDLCLSCGDINRLMITNDFSKFEHLS
jgi:hypothetical protein